VAALGGEAEQGPAGFQHVLMALSIKGRRAAVAGPFGGTSMPRRERAKAQGWPTWKGGGQAPEGRGCRKAGQEAGGGRVGGDGVGVRAQHVLVVFEPALV